MKSYLDRIRFYSESVVIQDSWELSEKDVQTCCKWIRGHRNYPKCMQDIKVKTLVREVLAHNLLYSHNLWPSHTKDVDLNVEPWYRRLCYYVLSLIYKLERL